MTSATYDTEKLRQLAQTLRDNKLDEDVTGRVQELEIPFLDWPLFAPHVAAGYEALRRLAEEVSKNLSATVEKLAVTVEEVADRYDEQEEQRGADLSGTGEQLGQIPNPGGGGEAGANRGAQGGAR
jgi:hypothetical protein